MSERRVVVTGLGVVSSIGIGKEQFWQSVINGKSGISKVESFDTSEYRCHYAGEVKTSMLKILYPEEKFPFSGVHPNYP